MQAVIDFFRHLLDPTGLASAGYLVVALIVFAETGLLAGFFLPGDSLLFTAGMLVGSSVLRLPAPLPQEPLIGLLGLQALLIVAAFCGNSTGYWIGSKAGPKLFTREESRFFKKSHLLRTQEFYEKHGGKTIILAEFMPFARTFAPVVAGIAQMPYRKFMTFNVIGVVVWIASMTTLGYFLGSNLWVRNNVEKVIIGIIVLSIVPAVLHVIKDRQAARGARQEA